MCFSDNNCHGMPGPNLGTELAWQLLDPEEYDDLMPEREAAPYGRTLRIPSNKSEAARRSHLATTQVVP